MIRYLTIEEIISLQGHLLTQSGGGHGLRDYRSLESSIAQPEMSFDGKDLYPSLAEKAAALGHSLIQNHPFVDGNKRIGHAAMEVFLILNGYEINASTDEQEQLILSVASGNIAREELAVWVKQRIVQKKS